MTDSHSDVVFLEKAGLVLLALQVAMFAGLWATAGFDSASRGFPICVMATALFVGGQRRLAARPPGRGAARWIVASRAAGLTMLALATLAIGYYRFVPEAAPAPAFVPRLLFAVLWIVIALKGAAMGKLKPGSSMGLCVTWTKESRLAWDNGHRTLGRILFWGGLLGLSASLIVPMLVSLAMWVGTVGIAVTAGLYESWRTWRLDDDRPGARPA